MKKIFLTAIAFGACVAAMAQSATEAYTLSPNDLRGTARFMSMGGAFTALGGDLSAITLNPASLGVYRSSEIGATLDISINSYKTDAYKENKTGVACNNFGYVGVVNLGGTMRTFAWGASYNRTASFDRITHGYTPSTSTSLSNYIAAFTNGTYAGDMEFEQGKYNPYSDSDIDWLSILGYSAYMINPINSAEDAYAGLYQNGTRGDADIYTRERGYIDEYNLSFGGNVEDVVMWGLNVGITDLSYRRETTYSESMENAYVPNYTGHMVTGNAGFEIYTPQSITGNGWNLNFGVIVKPINELRLGFSIKTPTWWNLSHGYYGDVTYYNYYDPSLPEVKDQNPLHGSDYTDDAGFDSRLRSPWKLNFGIAGVLGSSAIISLDYEHMAYPSMNVKYQAGYYGDSFVEDDNVNADIKAYYQGANSLRIGAEYRVTPQFSIRAGYAWQGSSVKEEAELGDLQIYTSGTDASYIFRKDTNQVSLGCGYRYKGWYIDAAYVYRARENSYHCYSDWDGYHAPGGTLKEHTSSIVLSTGFKF